MIPLKIINFNHMKTIMFFIAFSILSSCNNKNSVEKNNAVPFEVGTAMVDITPPVGFPRYGYPPVTSTDVLDPLYAKAIVFKQGETRGALVVCHLLGIPRDLSRIVREKASKETGIPYGNMSISATHTHTSPGITESFKEYALRESAGNLTEEDKAGYFTALINGITQSIIQAANNLNEVEIISGTGQAPGISFNRRYLMTDGRVRFNPGRNNPDIVRPAGPSDPVVSFVLFKEPGQNNFLSSLTVFSSHYVRGGTAFSADYPSFMQERFNELYGDKHLSVFGLGPCGDVNTSDPFGPPENADTKVKEFGYTLADAVDKALPEAKKGTGALEIVTKTLHLPMQDYTEEELEWSREEREQLYNERSFLNHRRRLKLSIWGVQPPLEKLRMYEAVAPAVSGEPWRLPVEIHVFKLDSQTAIVTMPGEMFTEFGIDIKKRSPFANTMLIELANIDIAYIPTIRGFQEGDYEAINSRLVPGSGEKMVDAALEILHELKN
jgi:hypothetical protein